MSQHLFETTFKGVVVTVTLGWDRPLQSHFLTIHEDPDEKGNTVFADGIVYSYLQEKGYLRKPLQFYSEKLVAMDIAVPSEMLEAAQEDAREDRGNAVVWYGPNGSRIDSAHNAGQSVLLATS